MNEVTDKTIQSWLIKAKKQSEKKYIYHKIIPSLYLRISTATNIGVFVYRVKKFATWYSIGEYPIVTLHDARAKAQNLKGLVSKDINPRQHEQEQQAKKKTVTEVFDLLMQSLLNKGSATNSQAMLNTFKNNYLSILANHKIEALMPSLIREQVLDPLIAQGKLNTAKNALLRFKQLSKFAYEREYTETNVLARLKNDFFIPRQRDRILNSAEIAKFLGWLNANDDTPAKHLKLSLMLGNRLEELLNINWDNVNLVDGTILLTDTKNSNNLLIKLPQQAIAVFNELNTIKYGDYVFSNGKKPYTATTIGVRLNKLLADTGIAKFTAHDLRRTFSSQLAEMGYSADLIDSATNHKLQGIRRNYIHTDRLQERYAMLQAWADYLEKLGD